MPQPLTVGSARALLTPRNSAAAPLVRDTFTDTNGTALASHTPEVGGPWAVAAGTVTIQSNQVQATALASGVAVARIEVGRADHTLDVLLTPGSLYADILTRYVDANNFTQVLINTTNSTIRIYEVVATVATLRATFVQAIGAGQAAWRLVTSGASLQVSYNGSLVLTYASLANLTATKVGLKWEALGVPFDDFVVTA